MFKAVWSFSASATLQAEARKLEGRALEAALLHSQACDLGRQADAHSRNGRQLGAVAASFSQRVAASDADVASAGAELQTLAAMVALLADGKRARQLADVLASDLAAAAAASSAAQQQLCAKSQAFDELCAALAQGEEAAAEAAIRGDQCLAADLKLKVHAAQEAKRHGENDRKAAQRAAEEADSATEHLRKLHAASDGQAKPAAALRSRLLTDQKLNVSVHEAEQAVGAAESEERALEQTAASFKAERSKQTKAAESARQEASAYKASGQPVEAAAACRAASLAERVAAKADADLKRVKKRLRLAGSSTAAAKERLVVLQKHLNDASVAAGHMNASILAVSNRAEAEDKVAIARAALSKVCCQRSRLLF